MVSHTPGNAPEAWDCSERLEGIHRAHLLPNATQDHSVPPSRLSSPIAIPVSFQEPSDTRASALRVAASASRTTVLRLTAAMSLGRLTGRGDEQSSSTVRHHASKSTADTLRLLRRADFAPAMQKSQLPQNRRAAMAMPGSAGRPERRETRVTQRNGSRACSCCLTA